MLWLEALSTNCCQIWLYHNVFIGSIRCLGKCGLKLKIRTSILLCFIDQGDSPHFLHTVKKFKKYTYQYEAVFEYPIIAQFSSVHSTLPLFGYLTDRHKISNVINLGR